MYHKLSIRFLFTNKVVDHYRTLQVSIYATNEQIKHKYYQLAKIYHPDSQNNIQRNENINDESFQKTVQMQTINQAYDILKDYHKRLQYDQSIGLRRQNPSYYSKNQKQTKQPFHSFFTSQAQRQFAEQQYRRRQQSRHEAIKILNKLFLSLIIMSGLTFTYYNLYINKLSFHTVRQNNFMLANQNINSSPTSIERRKIQYAEQMKAKNIRGNVVELKVRGAGSESTKSRQKRLNDLTNIPGVYKSQDQDLYHKQNQQIVITDLFTPINYNIEKMDNYM